MTAKDLWTVNVLTYQPNCSFGLTRGSLRLTTAMSFKISLFLLLKAIAKRTVC